MQRFFLISIAVLLLSLPQVGGAADLDADSDGLSDLLEAKFKTDIVNPDSDSDGYVDGLEINHGYDPLKGDGAKLKKELKLMLKRKNSTIFSGRSIWASTQFLLGKPVLRLPRALLSLRIKPCVPSPKLMVCGCPIGWDYLRPG